MFITVELDKFNKGLNEIESDLDKLIYTMKTIDTVTEPTQFPAFWTEEWLETAIRELDTRAMSPEKRMIYEMTIAANAVAVDNEQKKIEEAEERREKAVKSETVKNALLKGLDIGLVADIAEISIDFVLDIQRELAKNQ